MAEADSIKCTFLKSPGDETKNKEGKYNYMHCTIKENGVETYQDGVLTEHWSSNPNYNIYEAEDNGGTLILKEHTEKYARQPIYVLAHFMEKYNVGHIESVIRTWETDIFPSEYLEVIGLLFPVLDGIYDETKIEYTIYDEFYSLKNMNQVFEYLNNEEILDLLSESLQKAIESLNKHREYDALKKVFSNKSVHFTSSCIPMLKTYHIIVAKQIKSTKDKLKNIAKLCRNILLTYRGGLYFDDGDHFLTINKIGENQLYKEIAKREELEAIY